MKIKITYKSNSTYKNEEVDRYTEVHINYPELGDVAGHRVAFESDVIGTGFTRDMNQIEQIEVFQENIPDLPFDVWDKDRETLWKSEEIYDVGFYTDGSIFFFNFAKDKITNFDIVPHKNVTD